VTLASGLSAPAWADTVTAERGASVFWIQQGPLPGVQGNVHLGGLAVTAPAGEQTPDYIYGEILDYTCPDGYLPSGLSLEAQAQLDANCTFEDNLVIQTGDVALHVDGQLHKAQAVGTVDYIHTVLPGADGSLSINLRWNAPGDKTVVRQVVTRNPPVSFATITREASVVGTIGTEHVGTGTQIAAGQTVRYKRTVHG